MEKIASQQGDVNQYFFTVILQMKLTQKPYIMQGSGVLLDESHQSPPLSYDVLQGVWSYLTLYFFHSWLGRCGEFLKRLSDQFLQRLRILKNFTGSNGFRKSEQLATTGVDDADGE